MIASELNLNHTTVHQILTQELDMRKLCAKIVPKNTTMTIRMICVFIFWNGSKVTEILNTVQKQKDKVRNDTHLHHHVRKKRE